MLDMDTTGPLIKKILKLGTLHLPGQKPKDVKFNQRILGSWILKPFLGKFQKHFGFSLEPNRRMYPPANHCCDILIQKLRNVMLKGGCSPDEDDLTDFLIFLKCKLKNDIGGIRLKLKKEYEAEFGSLPDRFTIRHHKTKPKGRWGKCNGAPSQSEEIKTDPEITTTFLDQDSAEK